MLLSAAVEGLLSTSVSIPLSVSAEGLGAVGEMGADEAAEGLGAAEEMGAAEGLGTAVNASAEEMGVEAADFSQRYFRAIRTAAGVMP